MKKKTLLTFTAALTAGALALAGCSGEEAKDDSGKGAPAGDKDITIGMFNWDEGIAATHLWKHILEEEGYNVKIETADPGPVFQGVADGDYDLALDVWLPLTHESYIDQYGKDMVELGAWNDDALLTIAVNSDAPIDSLTELADNADVFDNKLVGIEAGAGLTKITEEEVIPAYGLEKMDFQISSTPAMLTELKSAMDKDRDIAVTLWKPHWAYDAFDIKDLEDPDHMLGEAESIFSYGSKEFPEKFPEVAEWITNFKMDTELLHSLENKMFNENEDAANYDAIVAEWVGENQEYVDSLTE